MAEGSLRLAEGHEEFFDYNCSQCETEDKYFEAIAYCPECASYFCRSCLDLHKRFLVTKGHVALDETRKEDWGTAKRGPKSGKQCEDHSGQMVTMFCEAHKALCCPVCVSLDHRTCKDMSFIPHIAKGIAQAENFLQTQAKVDHFLENITKAIATKKGDEAVWKESRLQILNEIANFRNRINTTLDRLEENLRKEIAEIGKPFNDEIVSDLRTCEEMGKTLQGFKDDLIKTENRVESELFIEMKRCQLKLSEYEHTIKKVLTPVKPRLVYTENASLLQDIEKAANIGEIEPETEMTNKLYKISAHDTKNVKLYDDGNTCYIDGICQLPSGQIIVSDKHNKRIKLLDAHYDAESSHDVPDKPYAVCCTDDTEIAVALANKSLLFIAIGDQIRNTKTIKLDHSCIGLACHGGRLFVSDLESRVYIYDLSGTRLRTIQHDTSGTDLFTATRHLAVSANAARLYVADRDKGLVVLDREGKPLSTLATPDLKGVRDVCLDPYGNVFLVCCLSHTVAQILRKGDKMAATVVEKKHGLHYPGVALFDRVRSCLLVANAPRAGCNTLNVYRMDTK